jgi:hypothetical protein
MACCRARRGARGQFRAQGTGHHRSILPTEATKDCDRIRILTIAPLIGEAIRRIADESSVSSLFD